METNYSIILPDISSDQDLYLVWQVKSFHEVE
jgi:hypothetical protein